MKSRTLRAWILLLLLHSQWDCRIRRREQRRRRNDKARRVNMTPFKAAIHRSEYYKKSRAIDPRAVHLRSENSSCCRERRRPESQLTTDASRIRASEGCLLPTYCLRKCIYKSFLAADYLLVLRPFEIRYRSVRRHCSRATRLFVSIKDSVVPSKFKHRA